MSQISCPELEVNHKVIALRDNSQWHDELVNILDGRFTSAGFGLSLMKLPEVQDSMKYIAHSYNLNVLPVYLMADYDGNIDHRPLLNKPAEGLSEFWNDFNRSAQMSFPFDPEQSFFLSVSLQMPLRLHYNWRAGVRKNPEIERIFSQTLGRIDKRILLGVRR